MATATGFEEKTKKVCAKLLSEGFSYTYIDSYVFAPVDDDEWGAVGKGSYNGQNVARVHLDDLRKGNVPAAGTPYTITLILPEDFRPLPSYIDMTNMYRTADTYMKEILEMRKSGKPIIFESGLLTESEFRIDDRVAALCGSPDKVETLCKILFSGEDEGGKGWARMGSFHNIYRPKEASFDAQAKGRMAHLKGGCYGGGIGGDLFNNNCRFMAVGAESAVRVKIPLM